MDTTTTQPVAAPILAEEAKEMQAESKSTTSTWLQPFIDDREFGLLIFEAALLKEVEPDVLQIFGNCFVQLKEKLGNDFVDEICFEEAFTKWQELKNKPEKTSTEIQLAQSNLEWLFARCVKDIYFLGIHTFPAMHFCGSAEALLMVEGREFHGYNERTLSKEKALQLANDMEASYQAVSGHESIYFMFMKPAISYADVVHIPETGQPANTCNINNHSRSDVLNCFLKTKFINKVFVPQMFIPSCGQVQKTNKTSCDCEHKFVLKSLLIFSPQFCCWRCSIEPLPCHICTAD